MLPLLLLLCLLPFGGGQAQEQYPITTDYGYLLPRYPESAAKERVNADFYIELKYEKQTVKDTVIKHSRIYDSAGQSVANEKDLFAGFVQSINKALRTWRLKQMDFPFVTQQVVVSFRVMASAADENIPYYYSYKVAFMDEMFQNPARIAVEYHCPQNGTLKR